MWLNQLYRRWTGRMRTNRQARRAAARPRPRLTLEALEERTLLSAPALYSLPQTNGEAVNVSTGQFGGAGSLSGNTGNQLDPSFIVNASVGSISNGFGAQVGLDLLGNIGLRFGYTVDPGTVNASYQNVILSQNYQEPTQFNQAVNFTAQNTNVSYAGGNFSTTSPSVSASADLLANLSGDVYATGEAFGISKSGSVKFNTGNVDQQLLQIGLANTGSNQTGLSVSVLGQDATGLLKQYLAQGISGSIDLDGIFLKGTLSGNTSPLSLTEDLQAGVGAVPEGVEPEEGNDNQLDVAEDLGSMDQYAPAIALNSNSLQSNGVLTDSGQSKIADMKLQAGPIAAALLAAPTVGPSSILGAGDTFTIDAGPASVSVTPVSFQIGPTLFLNQTGTIAPTNLLTYNFYTNSSESTPLAVDVTRDGLDLGKVSSVSFIPGVDNLSIQFAGAPITVRPTWHFGLNFQNEVDLNANLQGVLTAGELTASVSGIGSYTLGPAYQHTYNWFNQKVATVYSDTFAIFSETQALPSFTIGDTFKPSLVVNTTADGNTTFDPTQGTNGTLRGAVESANFLNSSTPQIIHLGSGTYTLSLKPTGSDDESSGDLNVSAQNLIIEGSGIGQTIINATGLGDRLLTVQAGSNLTLEGVTLENGSSSSNGGGILNYGNLTLKNCELSSNSAEKEGGGIYNEPNAEVVIDNGTLDGNSAGIDGGGAFNLGKVSISDSTLSGNSAPQAGGGVFNSGSLTVSNSTLSGNSTGYSILGAPLGSGGGIVNHGTLLAANSTLYGNTSLLSGGALFETKSASATLINDTITNNFANYSGYKADDTPLGGGIYVASGGTALLGNTIVAGNYNGTSSSTTADDITGLVDANRSKYNLIGTGGSGGLTGGNDGNQVGVINPGLGTLGNYGGPTQTVPLILLRSPVIDTGSNSWVRTYNLSTDQRGFSRIANATVDIGAVEYQYDLGLSGNLAPGTAPGTVQYVYTVTNNGPDPVSGATLTVPLPQGLLFQSLGFPAGWVETDPGVGNYGTVTFENAGKNPLDPTLPPVPSILDPGQSATFAVVAKVPNVAAGTVFTNTATVSPNSADDNLQNNSLSLTVTSEQEAQDFNAVKLFHFIDFSATADDFTASVGWGDGSGNVSNDGSGTVSVVADPNGGFDVLGSHIYAQSGSYGVAVVVAGLDGTQYSSGNIVQTYSNVKLFHFSDATPGVTAGDFVATVNWGDGTTSTISGTAGSAGQLVADSGGGFDVLGSHTYAQEGNYTVSVNVQRGSQIDVTIPAGFLGFAQQPYTNPKLFHFTSADPNATASDFSATVAWGEFYDETSTITSTASSAGQIVADPNGGFDVSVSHQYLLGGNYTITAAVTGPGMDFTGSAVLTTANNVDVSDSQQMFVAQTAPLTPGSLTPPANAAINQPITKALLFHFADADPNHTASDYTATVYWGDGTTNSSNDNSGTVTVVADPSGGFDVIGSHTYTQIVNSAKFAVQVSDEGGPSAGGADTGANVSNFQVLNADQPLTAGALNVPSVTTEGQSISNQVLFHYRDADSGAQASDYLAIVSWGDGTYSRSDDGSGNVRVVADPGGGFNVVGSHTYVPGSATFAVQVIDQGDPRSTTSPDRGGQSTGAASAAPLTIADPPVVVSPGPTFTAGVNSLSAVQTLATFTDPGGTQSDPNAYVATIQWGDGASSKATLNFIEDFNNQGFLVASQKTPGIVLGGDGKTFSVNLAHQYAQPGQFAVSTTINHDGTLSQTTTTAIVTAPAPPPALPPAPPPAPPPQPPTLQVPPLLAFFDSLLGAIETVNAANRTETLTASLFGIPLLVSTFDSSGKLETVLLFGMNVTALFELL